MTKAGLGSPGLLKMVIDRKRNLGPKTINKFIKALNFQNKRDEYLFRLLVDYDQSNNVEEKEDLFEKILNEKKKIKSLSLEVDQYELLSKWWIVTIYVMIGMKKTNLSTEMIQLELRRKISKIQIQESIELLKRIGLITEENGVLSQTKGPISTPDHIRDFAVQRYHESMTMLALDSVQEDSVSERNFNGVTVALSKKNYEKVCDRLNQFRKEINEMIGDDKEADRVYQLSLNLFPLTKVRQ